MAAGKGRRGEGGSGGKSPVSIVGAAEIDAALTALLFFLTPLPVFVSLVVAIAVVVASRAIGVPLGTVLPWFAGIVAVNALRILIDVVWRRRPDRLPQRGWWRLLTVQQAVHGLLWSIVPWLPVTGGWPHSEMLVFLSRIPYFGVMFGYAGLPRVSLAFILPYLLSGTVFLWREGSPVLTGIFLLILVLPFLVSLYFHRWLRRILAMRIANERLLGEARQARAHAEDAAAYLNGVLDTLDSSVAVLDRDFRLLSWNGTFDRAGLVPAGCLKVGEPVADLLSAGAEGGLYALPETPRRVKDRLLAVLRSAAARGRGDAAFDLADGRRLAIRTLIMPGGDIVLTAADVTAHRDEMKDTIWYITHHCGLTGLLNRLSLRPALEAMQAAQPARPIAVLELDVHRFREINSTQGGGTGDMVLRRIADRLRAESGKADILARVSADEFIIGFSGFADLAEAGERASRIIRALEIPFSHEKGDVTISVRAGIAVSPDHGATVDQLLARASLAHKAAKKGGQRNWLFYNDGIGGLVEEQTLLRGEVARALAGPDFLLYFQPQVDLGSGRILGAETLIRWRHEELGWISPARFIPIAETSNQIIELTEWILPSACREAKRWIGLGWSDFVVSVNISPVHFRSEGLVDLVYRSLVESGLPARNLELELTEGMILPDDEHVASILTSLGELGIRLAIDDFGTGYSAMSYLKIFPFQKLKIDISFIRDLDPRPETQSIVEAITRVGHTLGHYVVAEGVETAEQEAILKTLGCDGAQGFRYSEALPTEDFIEWVREYQGISCRVRR
jgi:diguanylate cyclase (GGDEF)-like protein